MTSSSIKPLFSRCGWTLKYQRFKASWWTLSHIVFIYFFLTVFTLHCSALMHSGDVLGESVRGYLHLQMAHLSIIHRVFEYFILLFILCTASKCEISHKKCSGGMFCLPSLWNTKLLWHCVFKVHCYVCLQTLKGPYLIPLSHTVALGDILLH